MSSRPRMRAKPWSDTTGAALKDLLGFFINRQDSWILVQILPVLLPRLPQPSAHLCSL